MISSERQKIFAFFPLCIEKIKDESEDLLPNQISGV